MAGAPLNSIDPIARAAEQVFGAADCRRARATSSCWTAVALDNTPNSISLGTNVRAIQTTYGAIATRNDVFIRDERMKKPSKCVVVCTPLWLANLAFKPASFTAVAGAGGADSAFAAGPRRQLLLRRDRPQPERRNRRPGALWWL